MKKIFLLIAATVCVIILKAQLCPGGGVNFAANMPWDQSWISGCTNGTSCTGSVELDNRSGCEPTAAMDACAPAPTCTSSTNGSDIWFRFFATATTTSIKVNQSVSFLAAIQAFSGGPACGGLTQIGCVVASGPSSGVTLNLFGLTIGQRYYFRVFGSASSAAQRNGVYCFCGSTGISGIGLPVVLTSFTTEVIKNKVILKWITASEDGNRSFDIERSIDGIHFFTIASLNGKGTTAQASSYEFTDQQAVKGKNFYRLKINGLNGRHEYSDIKQVHINDGRLISLLANPVHDRLMIDAGSAEKVVLMNLSGQVLQTVQLKQGRNEIRLSQYSSGTYIIKAFSSNESFKFTCIK